MEAVILSWEQVASLLGEARPPTRPLLSAGAGASHHRRDNLGRSDRILRLTGRHPFLTLDQIAAITNVSLRDARRLRGALISRSWVRVVPIDELVLEVRALANGALSELEFAELTPAGHRQLASWLGVPGAAMARYHGVLGGGGRDTGARRRLLRTLAHTLGTNSVFAALAQAAHCVSMRGWDDGLVEWRPAAACEWRLCKPDGYGCYQRNGIAYGFLVEYDRGTESARKYAASSTRTTTTATAGRRHGTTRGFQQSCSSQRNHRGADRCPSAPRLVRSGDGPAVSAHHHYCSDQR